MSNSGRVLELVNLGSSSASAPPLRIRVEPVTSLPLFPGSAVEPDVSDEKDALLGGGGPSSKNGGSLRRVLRGCLILAIFTASAVIAILVVVYYDTKEAVQEFVAADGTLLKISNIMANTADITHNLAQLTGRTDSLLQESTPVMTLALNTSSKLLEKLNLFAAHPILQIAGGALGG